MTLLPNPTMMMDARMVLWVGVSSNAKESATIKSARSRSGILSDRISKRLVLATCNVAGHNTKRSRAR
jgi:hypothetical protein